MIGETIAHYTITEKIGAGGMGEVYRARDEKLNRDVALKIIPEIFAQDAQRMGRFQREAQLLASLNHANIAAIYGVEEDRGHHALVLELVVAFDLEALETVGEPFILDPNGSFPSVARDGALLYSLGSGSGLRQLVRVNQEGEVLGTIGQPQAAMESPEVSPDGSFVLVSAREADNRDIWLHDVERGTRTRMTFGTETDWGSH